MPQSMSALLGPAKDYLSAVTDLTGRRAKHEATRAVLGDADQLAPYL